MAIEDKLSGRKWKQRKYPINLDELRKYLAEKIAGRNFAQLKKDGDVGLYAKARKSGNLDLVKNTRREYPTNPEELREYLKREIGRRNYSQLKANGDVGLYVKAWQSDNLELVGNKEILEDRVDEQKELARKLI